MLKILKQKIWDWPNGLVWRLTNKFTGKSRRRRFDLFMEKVKPSAEHKVLDVGVGEGESRAVNFFEYWYPWKDQITAVALEDLPGFCRNYPQVNLVLADGRNLPFGDNSFDIYFSNAVIEHVGSYDDQKKFIQEACRVADKVFISTPYRWFPLDAHTMIPFAHWLPMRARNFVYKMLGRSSHASEKALRLTDVSEIRSMLPRDRQMKVYPQRVMGLVSNLNVLIY